jgi:hypothetical protein
MMTYQDAIARIESLAFSIELNVVSSLTTFMTALRSEEAIQRLVQELKSERVQAEVCGRILHLLRHPIDPAYENPHDVSLAAYVLSLYWRNAAIGRMAALWVSAAKNTWWAARISSLVLRQKASQTPHVRMRDLFSGDQRRPCPPGGLLNQWFVWQPVPENTAFTVAVQPSARSDEFMVQRVEPKPRTGQSLRYTKDWLKEAA